MDIFSFLSVLGLYDKLWYWVAASITCVNVNFDFGVGTKSHRPLADPTFWCRIRSKQFCLPLIFGERRIFLQLSRLFIQVFLVILLLPLRTLEKNVLKIKQKKLQWKELSVQSQQLAQDSSVKPHQASIRDYPKLETE